MLTVITRFLLMVGAGSGTWFIIKSLLINRFINFHIVNFPQYSLLPQFTFIIALANWGILFICLIPAALYLWSNTQTPEVSK